MAYARFLSFINYLLTGWASVQVNTHSFQSGERASAPADAAAIRAALFNLPNDDHPVYHTYNPEEQVIAAWYPIGPDSNLLEKVGFIKCARMPVLGAPVVGGAVIPATHMVHPDMVGAFAVAAADAVAPNVQGFYIPYCSVTLVAPTPDEAFLYQACGLRTFHVQARGGARYWVTAETLVNLTADLSGSNNLAFEENGHLCVDLVGAENRVDLVGAENRVVRCRVRDLM
ncbi:MAG: hypothetical protein EBS05_27495 [Proteobacteria bacterium]|nr:hypothetical protein [Pseudomonadota bacterium]